MKTSSCIICVSEDSRVLRVVRIKYLVKHKGVLAGKLLDFLQQRGRADVLCVVLDWLYRWCDISVHRAQI